MATVFIGLILGMGLFAASVLLWFGSAQWRQDRSIRRRRRRHRHRH